MKLKKVTALLLATSMVVSSVSVASFADELVFEEEAVATVDNAGEEASFDDVVFEDEAEDDADYSEEVFEDEEIEEDAAVDEAFYTEEVVEDQPAEETDEQNADVYAALAAGEDVVVEDTVVEDVADEQTVTDVVDYADPIAATATLKEISFTYGVEPAADKKGPSFNYVEVTTADEKNLSYLDSWSVGATFTKDGKTVTPADPWKLVPGTYTVTFADRFSLDGENVQKKYAITVAECTVTVNKAAAYAVMPTSLPEGLTSIKYGQEYPLSKLSSAILTYKDKEGNPLTDVDASGTATFTTTYKKGDYVGKYKVSYADGLVSDKYEIAPLKGSTADFTVAPTSVKIVPETVTVEYGAEPVEPKYSFKDIDSGSAAAMESDIADKKVTLSVFVTAKGGTTKVTPKDPGEYGYYYKLTGEAAKNYTVTVDTTRKYTVKNAVVTFADYEGVYDGKYHGIIVTPDPSTLPNTVKIYYSENKTKPAQYGVPVEKIDPGKTSVYYFVEQDGKQTDYGYKTITILDAGKAYEEVEAMIDKLPAADKVTAADKPAADAAKAAFDALPAEQQAKIPAAKVEKLNAVKAAADKAAEDAEAAKAVEDKIDALPEVADVTADTKPAADEAQAAYDALTDAQKALIPKQKAQKLSDVKAAADKAAEEKDKEAEKEKEAFDQEVVEVKAAKNGTEGKAAAAKAKEAYENLSPEAKAKLTEEEIAAYEATQDAYKEGKVFENADFNGQYRVLSGGEVTYVAPLNKSADFFVVHNSVENNGFHYDVVKVSQKAFLNCTNAKKIKVGKNVKNIGAYAFKKTSAMTKLIVNTSNLQSGKVTNAFVAGGKGKSGVQLKVEVPSGKSTAYENLFKGEGGMKSGAKFTEKD